jgi:hypothetical protein
MTNSKLSLSNLGYSCAMLFTVAGIVSMGFDNAARLERCEASGRGAAECRLLVLGR